MLTITNITVKTYVSCRKQRETCL